MLKSLRARLLMLWQHLFRAAARRAWAIVGLCFALVVVLDARDSLPELREFLLIVAGVAAGAIFLPELSASLWDLDPQRIRNLVPLAKVRGLHRAIVKASLGADEASVKWGSVVWSQAIEPLLVAGIDQRTIVWDVSYDIAVKLHRTLPSAGEPMPVSRVSTRLRYQRVLPVASDGKIWVSAARTDSAMRNEFQVPACLLRELVPLPALGPEAWGTQVLAQCKPTLSVNARPVLLKVADEQMPDIVRWEATLDDPAITKGYVDVEVSFDYPMDSRVTDFPVDFPGYYCAGATRVAFTLDSSNDPAVRLRAQKFLAAGLDRAPEHREPEDTGFEQRLVYLSPKDALLWPGSGVHFEWPHRPSEVTE